MNLIINDKTYPLRWGFAAMEIYCDKLDCDLPDIEKGLASPKLIERTRAIYNLTVAAIECGCKQHGMICDIDYDTFSQWLDSQTQEVAESIVEDWKKSYFFGKTVAEYFFGEIEPEVTDENTPKIVKKKRPSVK